MRAILIDPATETLSEIQISNEDAEHEAILQTDDLYRGPELGHHNETGKDLLILDNHGGSDGPGFIRCLLAMRTA